jgi:hypothetical protein
MRTERPRRTARLEKRELAEIPSHWSKEEQGSYLWRLLRDRGIDPGRLYTVEYFPYHQCWLVTQEAEREPCLRPVAAAPPSGGGRPFYTQVSTELRRTALTAVAALAAHSDHFARFGCKYQLPPKPQETTPADLVRSLGGQTDKDVHAQFTSEGGWQAASPHGPKPARRD